MAMASASSSRTELIVTSSPGRSITTYDALFPAANMPRHRLAVAGPAFFATSHVSPAMAVGSIRLLRWCSPAPVHSLPTPEPVAPLAATPNGSHLFTGGMSGHVHALSLSSGDIIFSFSAHKQAVSCLVLNDDSSLLISAGEDGTVAVFLVLRVLDIDDNSPNDQAAYCISTHVAPVTSVTSGHCGCNAIVVSSSMDGTCKFWSMANGSHKTTIAYPCTVWSVTLDPTSCYLYAGGSDGSVHVTYLKAHHSNIVTWHDQECNTSSNSNNVIVLARVALASDCKNLVSCLEDGVVKVWSLRRGLVTSSFWINGVASDVLVIKRFCGRVISGDHSQMLNGVFGSNYDDEIWRRVKEVEEMEEMFHVVEDKKRRAMELVEMAVDGDKRNLHLMLREVDACNNAKKMTIFN